MHHYFNNYFFRQLKTFGLHYLVVPGQILLWKGLATSLLGRVLGKMFLVYYWF